MFIQSISLAQPRIIKTNRTQNINKQENHNNFSYNPVAYRDYNISFGDRLFRTPENFYEQDFNRENMPETMASYLFGNYEDRKHIPPAQMMKIVFNDINNAKTLEEVKELYPNEPLFTNLHSMSNKKYREGILAEIRYLKEADKSLFKNGKDDLGLYILKKIYVEGKTLKEINKDFKKDISVVYEGISDINYRDLANFGIKFPKGAFWHSFYVTRDDFPYVSVKKKDSEFHAQGNRKKELTLSDINNGNIEPQKPRYKVKDHEIKDMTGAIMEDFGDKEKTDRNLKRKFKTDDPKLTFIKRYMSEIMSISLDRVHASDEMRAFFEDYENIDKSARTRMKKYWDTTPEMKALQGLVMSDTIKLFFEYYGADGNNELFTDLIDYARSIKPEREKQLTIHNEKQKYYDELGEELSAAEIQAAQTPKDSAPKEIQTTKEAPGQIYKDKLELYINGEKYSLYSNLNEELTKCVNMNFKNLLPKAYSDKYARYLCKSDLADDIYKFTIISKNSNFDYSRVQAALYDDEKLEKITDRININFMKKYPMESRAAHQAFVDTLCKYIPEAKEGLAGYIYKAMPLDIPLVAQEIESKLESGNDFMTEKYQKYLQPLNNKEGKEIANKICKEFMRNYDWAKPFTFKPNSQEAAYLAAFGILFEGEMNAESKSLRNNLQQYIINEYGPSARAILDDTLPGISKLALSEQIVHGCLLCYNDIFANAYSNNWKARNFLLFHNNITMNMK